MLSGSMLEENLAKLGVSDPDKPSAILIYPKDFESKEKITELINGYNAAAGEENEIKYTDVLGLMMSSVTTIVNIISYVLIAFVAISLVVSSIMIGIITYISVLERTKEIGILRAVGASRKDVARVFNAETLIIGFAAGVIGIAVTLSYRSAMRGRLSKSHLVLNDTEPAAEKETADAWLGCEGVTVTALRPEGFIEIGEKRLSAASVGDFIEKGVPVLVTGTEGGRCVVRRKA